MRLIAILFTLSLVSTQAAHAAFELDVYGGYAFPAGPLLDQYSALATSEGITATKGGAAGGVGILFGKEEDAVGGLDIGSFSIISFSKSGLSDSVSVVPILGLLRLRKNIFLLDLGVGLSGATVSGAVNGESSGADATFMAGAGLTLGGTVGVDLGARFYYIIDSGGNIRAFLPFAGIHLCL